MQNSVAAITYKERLGRWPGIRASKPEEVILHCICANNEGIAQHAKRKKGMLIATRKYALLKASQGRSAPYSFLGFQRTVSLNHRLLPVDFVQGRQEPEPSIDVESE